MKKHLFAAVAVIGTLLMAGCDKEPIEEPIKDRWIIDWAPVNLNIEAVDASGNSIISPEMPGMTATFKGETYTVKEFIEPYGIVRNDIPTKAYFAQIKGLLARKYAEVEGKPVYRLIFGEIDGAKDMDEDIVLKWPDGSQDIIHYHCSDHTHQPPITCNRWFTLNGKDHEGNTFKFTGKSL